MNRTVLKYVKTLESYKTAIKNLHWSSDNLPQHELCDKIADAISDFQDQVSEVEQAISGRASKNLLSGITGYNVKNLKSFVNDVISSAKRFHRDLDKMGDKYIGMKSDVESFISVMQRNLYLVDFTLKEELRRRIRKSLNERMYKSPDKSDDIDKCMGQKPKKKDSRVNRIEKVVKEYGITRRKYKDSGDEWKAFDDYKKVIDSIGCEFRCNCSKPEKSGTEVKECPCEIRFEDGMVVDGIVRLYPLGEKDSPFSTYETEIALWSKEEKDFGEESISENLVSRIVSRVIREGYEDGVLDPKYDENNLKDPKYDEYESVNDLMTDVYTEYPQTLRRGYPEGKDGDIEYSWDLYNKFHDRNDKVWKQPEIDFGQEAIKKRRGEWSEDELSNGRLDMNHWVHHGVDLNDPKKRKF